MKKEELKNKNILAVDYGQKYTGLATFKYGRDPFPLMHGRLRYFNDNSLITDLNLVIEEEFIDLVILGIPYFTDGTSSKMTQTVRKFGEELKDCISAKLVYIDETLTTFEAEERMKQDPKFNFKVDLNQIDALSAVVILEEFLKSFSD